MATNEELNESRFTGSAFENWVRGLAVFFVTLITIGIAYPFMLVWKLKWEARNTYVNGHQLRFDGNGGQLLGNYLLWMLLSLITIGIYAILCLPLNMNRWTAKHTHFADAQGGASEFNGHIWQFFGARFVASFVTLITIGIGHWWATCYLQRWVTKHTVYDGAHLEFNGGAMEYFGKSFVWGLLTVITLGIYSIWSAVKRMNWFASHTHIVAAQQ